MTSRITKWITTGLTVAMVSTGLIALTAEPAAAATVIRCVGSTDVFYSPGLTNFEQEVSFRGGDHAVMCSSQVLPGLHSFEGPFAGTDVGSCPGRLAPGGGVERLIWNGNPDLTSVWQFNYTVQRTSDMVIYTATGPVTSGVAAGTNVSQQMFERLSDFDACTQPGGMQVQRAMSNWVFSS